MEKDTQTSNEEHTSGKAAAERGKKAIDAQQISLPKPEEQQKQSDEKDAERWRNEG